jgi:hypothetical protein
MRFSQSALLNVQEGIKEVRKCQKAAKYVILLRTEYPARLASVAILLDEPPIVEPFGTHF